MQRKKVSDLMNNNNHWTPEQTQVAAEGLRNEVRAACEANNVDLERLIHKLAIKINAKETKAAYDQRGGEWVYSAPLEDHAIQIKAATELLHLLDAYPAQKRQLSGPNGGPIPITNVSDEERAELKAMAKVVAEKEKKKIHGKVKVPVKKKPERPKKK